MSELRKLSAHYIFPVNAPPIRNGIITIDADGVVTDLHKADDHKEDYNVEFYNGIIVPGFINSHCHLELSYLQHKFTEGGGMTDFISQMKEKRSSGSENAVAFAEIYDKLMFKEGIVAVADIVNSDITASLKKQSRIHYINFIEVFSLIGKNAGSIFENALKLKDKYTDAYINPHALYSLSPGLAELLSKNKEKFSSLHFMEADDEAEYLRNSTGKLYEYLKANFPDETIQSAKPESLFDPSSNVLLVHNVCVSEAEEKQINEVLPNNFKVLCPSSNQFISKKTPSYKHFDPTKICLGTDSLASGKQLSMLNEMMLMQNAYPKLSFETALLWATLNGAKALGLSDKLGSFEIGKKPGVVLIENFDFQTFRLTPATKSRRMDV